MCKYFLCKNKSIQVEWKREACYLNCNLNCNKSFFANCKFLLLLIKGVWLSVVGVVFQMY